MPLLTYEQARPWAKAIKSQVLIRAMPPWFADPKHGRFINDRALKQTEIDTIGAWADGGATEGDPDHAPPPVRWPDQGWLIKPDVVVSLPDYPVPARGVLEWETIAIPSPFKGDTWVTSTEILPSEPSVVHHICFDFVAHKPDVVYNRYEWAEVPRDADGVQVRPGLISRLAERVVSSNAVLMREVGSTEVKRRPGRPTLGTSSRNCYVPGMSTHDYRPHGAAKLVPAGFDIVLTVHYTANGKAVVDKSRLGFTVARQPPARKFVHISASGANSASGFAIPPNEPNYLAPPVDIEIKRDVELVWLWPHMHMRGKDVTYTLVFPDGRREIVLRVPRYDFNWQLPYMTSISVPKGSRMHVEAHYDNSRNNRANPNPNTWVYPGKQSWEEMFTPAFGLIVGRDVDERQLTSRYVREEEG
jgi:hypothetical protein